MRLIKNKEEATIAVEVLAETYANAPNISWMFEQSRGNLQSLFGMLVKDAIKKESAYLTSNNYGVLLLYDLEAKHFSLSIILRKLHLILFVMGIRKSLQVMRLNQLKRQRRPETGYYGSVLAIKDNESRWRTVLELKREFSILSEKLNQPIYLETTNPRIFSLYEKLGFTQYHKMKHPYTNLDIYFMKMD